jgi:hypothetical protein
VHRRLRIDVANHDATLVLMDNLRWNVTRYDPAE